MCVCVCVCILAFYSISAAYDDLVYLFFFSPVVFCFLALGLGEVYCCLTLGLKLVFL